MDTSDIDLLAMEADSSPLSMSGAYDSDDSADIKDEYPSLQSPDLEGSYGHSGDDQDDKSSKCSGKARYKHVPHREKPVQVVQRRNARERRRVQTVNSAFTKLRKHIPYENRHKRLSKVKTLRIAIDYINELKTMLTDHDTLLDGIVGGNHMAENIEMLQSTLNAAAAQMQQQTSSMTSMTPMQHHMQEPQLLPVSLQDNTQTCSSHLFQVNNMPSSLFTGTGSLLDLMTSSNVHQQIQTQPDWSNPNKDVLHDFLHIPITE